MKIFALLALSLTFFSSSSFAIDPRTTWVCQRPLMENDERLEKEVAGILKETANPTRKHVFAMYFSQRDPLFSFSSKTNQLELSPKVLVPGTQVLSIEPVSNGLAKVELVASGQALREILSPFNTLRMHLLWATLDPTTETSRAAALSLAHWIEKVESDKTVHLAKTDEPFAVNITYESLENAVEGEKRMRGLPVNVQLIAPFKELTPELENKTSPKLSHILKFQKIQDRIELRINFRFENQTTEQIDQNLKALGLNGDIEKIEGPGPWGRQRRNDGSYVYTPKLIVKAFPSQLSTLMHSNNAEYISLGQEASLSPELHLALKATDKTATVRISLALSFEGEKILKAWISERDSAAKILDEGEQYEHSAFSGLNGDVSQSSIVVESSIYSINRLLDRLTARDYAWLVTKP